jgi:glutamate--cysteine ligase
MGENMLNTKVSEGALTVERILSEYFGTLNKTKEDFKIGMEYERLPISKSTFNTVGYNQNCGIYELLRELAKNYNSEYITDDYNIIGLKNETDRITLEPGCQFELSINPEKTVFNLQSKIENLDKKLAPILKKIGISLIPYGISPVSTYKFINLIPKKRYHIMADYLWGILSDVMMRETAGIQVCFDFSTEKDAMKKFRLANMILPFVTAMFANSPIRGGVDTGYKSFRALAWLNTDNDRCGFINKNLFTKKSNYNFKSYIDDVLNTPMIFINRSKPIEINGKINFRQFMQNGFEGYHATMEDFNLQSNLCFPEVRLRNFIEIRNQDCVGKGLQYAIPALYKGILYNNEAMAEIEKMFSKLKYEDFEEFRFNVPRLALETEFHRYKTKNIAKEILKISQNSLKEMGLGEECFLDPIMELTLQDKTPADIIIKHWYSDWNKDISKLISFVSE